MLAQCYQNFDFDFKIMIFEFFSFSAAIICICILPTNANEDAKQSNNRHAVDAVAQWCVAVCADTACLLFAFPTKIQHCAHRHVQLSDLALLDSAAVDPV